MSTHNANPLSQQMCISNMNAKASELGCTSGDMDCLCKADDYQFGIRDCTKEACPNDDSAKVLKMALESCPSMFPSISVINAGY